MPVYTTALTSSTGEGIIAFSGTIQTSGFLSGYAVGNASYIDDVTIIPESYNSLLYGPIKIRHSGSLTVSQNAIAKIKDIEDA